jgi:uncharacterized membrane protein YozB (DUF420 family)
VFPRSGYVFAALTALAIAAFWPRYLSRPLADIDLLTHLHALAMTAWCGLLIAQPFFIRGERRSLHRALGRLSYGLVPFLLAVSLLLAHSRFRVMDDATFVAEASSLYLPLSSIGVFGLAYGLAVAWRRQPALHARFMVCTALTLVDPVVARVLAFYLPPFDSLLTYQAITFGCGDPVLLALFLRDPRELRWPFGVMLAAFVPVHLLWFTWVQGDGWRVFAQWFRALPLTQ